MCILSIYRSKNQYILTHNRDEYDKRKSSETLVTKKFNGNQATYPEDLQAHGTWILTSEKWTTAILNGADVPHKHKPPYKHSRGNFPMKLMSYQLVEDYFFDLDLNGIEPFTQIILDNHSTELYKISWNEIEKKIESIDDELFVISSSTLYSNEKKKYHKHRFSELTNLDHDTLAELHCKLAMRDNPSFPHVKTTSQVQIVKNMEEKYMNFKNYIIREQFG